MNLNGRLTKLEQLNGHSKPPDHQAEVKKRVASRQEQLGVWQALVDWFAGDHSYQVHGKLIWEPSCTLGPLLPQLPAYRPGVDDPTIYQIRDEHWRGRMRVSLSAIVSEWLERGLSPEELKKPRYLSQALKEAGEMIILPDEEWPALLEHHYEYYKSNPAAEVQEMWGFNFITFRLSVRRYIDGRFTKNINGEQIPAEPGSRAPHYWRGYVEEEFSQAELDEILNNRIE